MVCILKEFKSYLLDPYLQQVQPYLDDLAHPETLYEPERSWILVVNKCIWNEPGFFFARLTF